VGISGYIEKLNVSEKYQAAVIVYVRVHTHKNINTQHINSVIVYFRVLLVEQTQISSALFIAISLLPTRYEIF